MRIRWAARISTALALVFLVGVSSADPILVNPTADGSSISIVMDGCQFCSISASISSSLDDAYAMLDVGESFVVDFFDVTVGGLGGSNVTAYAQLAFLIPDLTTAATGQGSFKTFFGLLSSGSLIWNQPELIDLGDGSSLQVGFEDLYEFGIGNTTTVSAYISRIGTATSVPEPGMLVLFGIGLLGMGLVRRRKFS